MEPEPLTGGRRTRSYEGASPFPPRSYRGSPSNTRRSGTRARHHPGRHGGSRAVLQAAKAFILSCVQADSEMDNYATRALIDHIEDMSRWLKDIDGPTSLNVWEWLGTLPSSVWIMGSGPRPGRMHVAGISSGGFSGRAHTFIIGLDDGRFPGTALNDPVLLDNEREKLSDKLPTVREQIGQNVERFVRLLARLRGTITLSYPSFDLKTDRTLFPSPVFVCRVSHPVRKPDRRSKRPDAMAQPAASFAPAEENRYLDETEWWLWRLCGKEHVRDPLAALDRRFPVPGPRRLALAERKSNRFTEYDGLISEVPEELDPFARSGPVMSSAMLETIGACALRYFFKYVLGIRPAEQLEFDPAHWLDPIQFGNLLPRRILPLHERAHQPATFPLRGARRGPAQRGPRAEYRAICPHVPATRSQRVQATMHAITPVSTDLSHRRGSPEPISNASLVEVSVGMRSRETSGQADTEEPVIMRTARMERFACAAGSTG